MIRVMMIIIIIIIIIIINSSSSCNIIMVIITVCINNNNNIYSCIGLIIKYNLNNDNLFKTREDHLQKMFLGMVYIRWVPFVRLC